MRLSVFNVANQKKALEVLYGLVEKSTVYPTVRNAALAIVSDCPQRDDECEINAIFEAVKNGTNKVQGLEKGLKYMADPRWADHFSSAYRILSQCKKGFCAEDCDGHACLIAALAGALGFTFGLRVWGPTPDEFTHVYAVVGFPKGQPTDVLGLDTTVDKAYVGWEPPRGHTMTVWPDWVLDR